MTSIRQHEVDILLCAEITTKVMRMDTLYDILVNCRSNERDMKTAFQNMVLGTTVLTDYTNKTYRIDEVDFTQSPSSTFNGRNGPTSYMDYYRDKYNIKIRDPNQPLLISRARARDIRAGQNELIALVPELCRATGMTTGMMSNFNLTRAVAAHTRINPHARIQKLLEYNSRLSRTPASTAILTEWNMRLDPNLIELPARILPSEMITINLTTK